MSFWNEPERRWRVLSAHGDNSAILLFFATHLKSEKKNKKHSWIMSNVAVGKRKKKRRAWKRLQRPEPAIKRTKTQAHFISGKYDGYTFIKYFHSKARVVTRFPRCFFAKCYFESWLKFQHKSLFLLFEISLFTPYARHMKHIE